MKAGKTVDEATDGYKIDESKYKDGYEILPGCQITFRRGLSANSPAECSAEKQPVTWDGFRAPRGARSRPPGHHK